MSGRVGERVGDSVRIGVDVWMRCGSVDRWINRSVDVQVGGRADRQVGECSNGETGLADKSTGGRVG